jgi:hypothetical protein
MSGEELRATAFRCLRKNKRAGIAVYRERIFFIKIPPTRRPPMLPREHETENGGGAAVLEGQFTPEELAKLLALRALVATLSPYDELGLDEKRLKFARWLVEHGRLSDGR